MKNLFNSWEIKTKKLKSRHQSILEHGLVENMVSYRDKLLIQKCDQGQAGAKVVLRNKDRKAACEKC